MRKIASRSKRAFGYHLGAAAFLIAILQLGSLPTLAQVAANLDYYAPRTLDSEKQHFANVTNYHIPPGQDDLAKARYITAVAHAEFVLRYFPNHPQALSLLSAACLTWKNSRCDATADEWFQKAIARNPDAAPTYVLYALHLHRKERLKEAVEAYRRAIELAPESINAHYNLAIAYMDLKQYDLANQHAQKSYQLGASPPGLRARLEKAGKWNPNVSMPASEASAGKADGQPAPQDQKTPDEPSVTK